MILIPYNMFDDGSIECKTFILCAKDEIYYTEIDNEFVQAVLPLIKTAMQQGKRGIDVRDKNFIYKGRHWDDLIVQILWD